MKKFTIATTATIASALLYGCARLPSYTTPPIVCPEPATPECTHTAYTGAGSYDTAGGAWTIARVDGNSEADEWQLVDLGPTAYLTRGDTENNSFVQQLSWNGQDRLFPATAQSAFPHRGHSGGVDSKGAATAVGKASKDTVGMCGIYLWRGDTETMLVAPSASYWIGHPTLFPDVSVAIVASNRPGGEGGVDLWAVEIPPEGEAKRWVNLGPSVNTPCDEITPHLSRDGKALLFASAGHRTLGGYDVFSVPIQTEEIKKALRNNTTPPLGTPQNLGSPVNSRADDIFASFTQRGIALASNREGSVGGFDIYHLYPGNNTPKEAISETAKPPKTNKQEVESKKQAATKKNDTTKTNKQRPTSTAHTQSSAADTASVNISGTVVDGSGNSIAKANVTVRKKNTATPYDSTVSDDKGKFTVKAPTSAEIEITASSDNGFYATRKILTDTSAGEVTVAAPLEVPKIFTIRINFPYDVHDSPYEYVLDDRGAATDKEWSSELGALARHLRRTLRPGEKITITGHTDDAGSESYNAALGRRRAEFVAARLVNLGVPAEAIRTASAGKAQLLQKNSEEDTETWRRRCRRIEFSRTHGS